MTGLERQPTLHWWQQLIKRFAYTKLGVWAILRVWTYTDPLLMRLTDGRLSMGSLLDLRQVLLTTTGAKTGQERTVPLLYFMDGKNMILIASCGGSPRHPAWYHNLRAKPEARVLAHGHQGIYVAHAAEGEERNRLWNRAVDMYPGFDVYAGRTGERLIPVMVLEPRKGVSKEYEPK